MLGVLGQVLISIASFLLVLTFIVTIHELGHFLVARAFGVKVDRFAVGFGKAVASRTDRHGIEWRLGWLPLGGYVKFSGDLDASSVPDRAGLDELRSRVVAERGPGAERDYFHFKPVWQRALIVAAGPIANFILAITIFAVVFMAVGVSLRPARVAQVQAGSPAAAAGFRVGDLITEVNGKAVKDGSAVTRTVMLSTGDPVRFTVERAGRPVELVATPERREENDPIAGRVKVGRIGLGLGSSAGDVRHVRYGPVEAVAEGARQTADVIGSTLTYLGRLATGRESGDQFSGPLGMAKATGSLTTAAVEANPAPGAMAINLILTLTTLAAILSIGIGFLNLLPIPVLDGGHLLFYGYEAVAKRPVSARFQEMGYRAGLALLAGFMLFATWNDLQKLNIFQFLGGLVS
ncbi:RIP metalloprotease [Brevundimonas sp. SPF441]|uniref:M50 family metallopeptidase n=1 Tax=Brevundimonas sp. SPF441 TaxID=2663795 RepID=UPI00129E2981|nr:M50 family metallopeptidase [Brevundimonas sp. SPF441]MRL67951.1 PDZ domain-containing protein [Brevundimonas sp. SPF441]